MFSNYNRSSSFTYTRMLSSSFAMLHSFVYTISSFIEYSSQKRSFQCSSNFFFRDGLHHHRHVQICFFSFPQKRYIYILMWSFRGTLIVFGGSIKLFIVSFSKSVLSCFFFFVRFDSSLYPQFPVQKKVGYFKVLMTTLYL